MDKFQQSLQAWQFFFSAVATSSATLTGLLFVSLTFNRARMKGENAHLTLGLARNTFGDFLYVLMIALIFLVPHSVPISLSIALITLGLASGFGTIWREIKQYRLKISGFVDAPLILRRLGLPAIASLGLIFVAIEVAMENFNAIYGLVIVIAALLVMACWNAWILLVEE
jgi:hypothetical protein